MTGGDDKKQDGSIPGTSGRTATTQVGQTLEIIQKRSCPYIREKNMEYPLKVGFKL